MNQQWPAFIRQQFSQNYEGEIVIHGQLERILRRIAFAHRDIFPELKASMLVRTWQMITGLKW